MKKFVTLLVLAFGMIAFAQKDVTITYITGNRSDDVKFDQGQAQKYMDANPHTIGGEDYNVTINVIAGPESATDRAQQYLQYFEANSGEVDVMQIDVIWPGDLAENLVDLNQYDGFQEAASEFFPAIVENNTVDGKLVGMPLFTDAGLLYYRTDLLEKYGYSNPPATWSELQDMAQTIQDGEKQAGNQDFTGFVWQGDAYEGLTCDALEWIASSGGGRIVSPDKVITINNENAVNALQRAADWVGTISPAGVTGYKEEDARGVWQNGNAAFMRNWPYAYVLGNGSDSAVAGKFAVSALPAGDNGEPAATLGGWQLAVNKYSKNPAVAADVVLFYTNAENQLARAEQLSALPTRPALYQSDELLNSDVAFMAEFLPVFEAAVARPSTATAPNYLQASQLFFSAVHNVLTGQEDAETALALLEQDLQDLTGFETGQPE